MKKDKNIDFDCEFYRQKVVNEGDPGKGRRTTDSVIYHICVYDGEDNPKRCNLKDCPKK